VVVVVEVNLLELLIGVVEELVVVAEDPLTTAVKTIIQT
jgi:hypothetical protein